jgi:hypothetical protein
VNKLVPRYLVLFGSPGSKLKINSIESLTFIGISPLGKTVKVAAFALVDTNVTQAVIAKLSDTI